MHTPQAGEILVNLLCVKIGIIALSQEHKQ